MLAGQIVAPGRVEIVEVPRPEPKRGEALVKVQKATLCGSDLHVFHGHGLNDSFPLAPGLTGHEVVGQIVEGPEAAPAPGTLVLVVLPSEISRGFAEYMAVDTRYLIPLPAGFPAEQLVLAQQLGTVIYCCRRLTSVLDRDVVILGQGPAGLLFTYMMRSMGARVVIGIDVVESRLAVARQMGATVTVNPERVDPVGVVRELTDGQLADVVIEAVGRVETINQSLDLVKERGHLVYFGVPEQETFSFEFGKFFRKFAVTVTNAGTQQEPGRRSFRLALKMITEGRIDLSRFVSHRRPLERLQEAFELADTRHNVVKVIIEV